MSLAVKNGKAYDSADVTIAMFGIEEEEVKEIVYADTTAHQLNKSLKSEATSWSMGDKTFTCSLSLYMAAVVRLQKMAKQNTGKADLTALKPFPVTVVFANDDHETVTDTVYVKFQGAGRSVNGEMGLAQQFEMFCLGVNYMED